MAALVTRTVSAVSRVSVCVGAVYLTYQYGVWSPDTSRYARRTISNLTNTLSPDLPEYTEQLPERAKLKDALKCSWNKGVIVMFNVMGDPDINQEKVDGVRNSLSNIYAALYKFYFNEKPPPPADSTPSA